MGLSRHRLGGRTIVEYTAASNGQMEDVEVVGSSGSVMVDEAALKATGRMKVVTNCHGRRFRHTVTFNLGDAPPPLEPSYLE